MAGEALVESARSNDEALEFVVRMPSTIMLETVPAAAAEDEEQDDVIANGGGVLEWERVR